GDGRVAGGVAERGIQSGRLRAGGTGGRGTAAGHRREGDPAAREEAEHSGAHAPAVPPLLASRPGRVGCARRISAVGGRVIHGVHTGKRRSGFLDITRVRLYSACECSASSLSLSMAISVSAHHSL